MPDLHDPQFWTEMDADFWEEVGETLLSVYLAGIDGGVNSLPKNLQKFVNAATLASNALRFLHEYRFRWLTGISETTREMTVRAYDDWIQSGAPLPVLEKSLESIYGKDRAESIAVTETTRLFAKGNQDAWEDTGLVDETTWMTAKDELVCPICGGLDGTHIGVGDIDASPPAHPYCRCYLQPIVSDDALSRKLDEILNA